jgi:hypothetical protein
MTDKTVQRTAEEQPQAIERPYLWTAYVANECHSSEPRELRFVATYDFDKAVGSAKELIAKKWPNKFDRPEWKHLPWHPDYELVGIRRGEELDTPEEEPT